MTITIIEANDRLRLSDLTWSITGGCFYAKPCEDCQFSKLINLPDSEFTCLYYREQFINYTSKTLLPYTFDTDDYPELLI